MSESLSSSLKQWNVLLEPLSRTTTRGVRTRPGATFPNKSNGVRSKSVEPFSSFESVIIFPSCWAPMELFVLRRLIIMMPYHFRGLAVSLMFPQMNTTLTNGIFFFRVFLTRLFSTTIFFRICRCENCGFRNALERIALVDDGVFPDGRGELRLRHFLGHPRMRGTQCIV